MAQAELGMEQAANSLRFLSVRPAYRPMAQSVLLELWVAVNAVYFTAGFLILVTSYRHLLDTRERHRVGRLVVAVGTFGLIAVHNIVGRNWHDWFGSARPGLFSPTASLVTDALFLDCAADTGALRPN